MEQPQELQPSKQDGNVHYPLTGLQTGLIIQAISNPGSVLDIVQVVCTLHGGLDLERLKNAWDRAVMRHDALRLAFQTENLDGPTQRVSVPFSIDMQVLDWTNKSADQTKQDLADWLEQDRVGTFRLDTPPLFRVTLIKFHQERFELVWTFHHLILDGRSIPIVLREVLNEAFYGIAPGTRDQLSGPSYRDYLRWYSERDSSLAKQFWKQYLSDVSFPTPLPLYDARRSYETTDMPLDALQIVEGEMGQAEISMLRSQEEQKGVSISTLLHATWALILARASGVDRVCYGTVRSCRYGNIPLAPQTVGMFTNTIPMVVRVPEDETIGTWLKQLRELQHHLRAFEHTGLSEIRSSLSRSTTSPLFESLLGFETQDPFIELSGSLGGPIASRDSVAGRNPETDFLKAIEIKQHTGIPLTIAARLTDRLYLRFSYDSRRFSRVAVERLLRQFIHVLGAIVRNPNHTPVSSLEILPEEQMDEQSVGFNNHHAKSTEVTPLHQLFYRKSLETPDSIAIEGPDSLITYRELVCWSAGVMKLLVELGVTIGTPIGIWMPPSPKGIAAILGILGRGGYYVPLPFDAPESRLAMIIKDAGLKLIFCISPPNTSMDIDEVSWVTVPDQSDHGWEHHVVDDDMDRMFCIIYTSGTTGIPKGVCLTHRGYANVMTHRTKVRFHSSDFECSPLTSPWHFDGSIVQLFSPLTTGGTLLIWTSVHELASSDAYHRLTALTGASTLIGELIRQHGVPRGVRVIGLGAEPVPPDLLEMLKSSPRFERLITGYGVTECSCYSTDYVLYDRVIGEECKSGGYDGDATNTIGKPISNNRIYVLDKERRFIPIGSVGEIYIGGVGVSRGYLRSPELTASKFVPDPVDPTSGRTAYRTGDLGRWREDGSLEFLGRLDHQIKLRGHRIEPGEIQAVLCQYPGVQQACVILREDHVQQKRLVAYCVAPQNLSIDLTDLRRYLFGKLTAYMVPEYIKFLSSIPLTSGGKIDFDRLPALSPFDEATRTSAIPPRTETEKRLVGIWEDLLQKSGIGIRDNFFELGGDSLLTLKLFARIKKQFDKTLPMALLYTESTIEQIAKNIETHQNRRAVASLIPLQAEGQGSPLIVMPSLFGELMFAKPMIDALGGKIPVLGLQPNLVMEHEDCFKDFRRTAFEYTKTIRNQYPDGPYSLLGYSYGGLLAFEVARQLRLQNQQIKLLAIIDTGPEERVKMDSATATLFHIGRVLANAPRWLIENLDPAAIAPLSARVATKIKRILRKRSESTSHRLHLNDLFDAEKYSQENDEALDRCFEGYQAYLPERYDGTITLFRADSRPLLHSLSADLGWKQFSNRVVVHRLRANHETIIQPPFATSIAMLLLDALLTEK
jgi:amino acid adenylation domain-containing protein